MRKHTRTAVCLHALNWLQALRLLATRGHYSIDLITGYIVAAFVSRPAEQLGLHFSRGTPPVRPSIAEAFEGLVGVRGAGCCTGGGSVAARRAPPAKESSGGDNSLYEVQSETSVRIAMSMVAGIARTKRD